MGIFTYNDHAFLMDGKEYTVLSGAMHYFRIPREYWLDRLTKLKECGFNTVETYTCWNLHEKHEGEFDFSGMLDIAEYVRIAESLGLNVILRPGPYICSEWEYGGLPAWLLSYKGMNIRCNDELFISKVRSYYHKLFEQLSGHFASQGGGIIMVQIENEYGSYGDDKEYLNAIVDIYHECGVDAVLFTSDGALFWMLGGGTLPEHLCVVNFGSSPKGNFGTLDKFRRNQPHMCGEFYCGWFDHWYEKHHTQSVDDLSGPFRETIESGASLNFYMFHGGTNFGFMNGANHGGGYEPTTTSYDYFGLISEAGDLTPSYYKAREIIEDKYGKLPPLTVKNTAKAAYGKVELNEKASVFDAAPEMVKPIHRAAPQFQEDIGQSFGYTLYSSVVRGPREELKLGYSCLHDRAVFYFDGKYVGTVERSRREDNIVMRALGKDEEVRVDILVENMGRINYGPLMGDNKGITGVKFGQQYHFGWDMFPLEMDDLTKVPFEANSSGAEKPSFMRGKLIIDDEPADTFIRLDDFHHGFVVVNGFNLGRYYTDAGPQKTLYCPAPMLKKGENEIIVFEMDSSSSNVIEFTDTPDFGL